MSIFEHEYQPPQVISRESHFPCIADNRTYTGCVGVDTCRKLIGKDVQFKCWNGEWMAGKRGKRSSGVAVEAILA